MTAPCTHDPRDHHVCVHVLVDAQRRIRRFSGDSIASSIVCPACADEAQPPMAAVCGDCFRAIEEPGWEIDGMRGAPAVLTRASSLRFVHETFPLVADGDVDLREALTTAVPLEDGENPSWVAIANDILVRVDLDGARVRPVCRIAGSNAPGPLRLHTSPDGRYVAIVESKGSLGSVVDIARGEATISIERGDYHTDVSEFPLAFFRHGDRMLVVCAVDWNRLEIADAATGTRLTERSAMERERDCPRPEHYLDYFHGRLTISPDGRWLVDDGWVWHPVGVFTRVDLHAWLRNPYESEDGPSRADVRVCYEWDMPCAFADQRTLVSWGFPADDTHILDAATIYDVEDARLLRWFAGPPRGRLAIDGDRLVVAPHASGAPTSVWDLATGERLLEAPGFAPQTFHPAARIHASFAPGSLTISRLVDG